ncbi:MAG: hypothetical protein RL685_5700 [Pseudomonadota bacterium]|jgi:hypothetical protein
MAKKKVVVSLRKPSRAPETDVPPDELTQVMAMSDAVPTDGVARSVAAQPVEPATIEDFVSGVAAALEQSASELRPSEVKELLQRGPAGYRELTVLLPEQLVLELERHCSKYNLDLSPLVATALEFHLHQATAKKSKRRERVAAVARALLGELQRRARGLWEARRSGLTATAPEPSVS